MKPIFMLVYTSRSIHSITQEMLSQILTVSRDLNRRDEITGFLTFRTGYFLQLLEGPQEKVLACYQRILKDNRHTAIILQGEATTDHRSCPDWNMGLVEVNENESAVLDLLDLFDLARAGEKFSDAKSLETLLRIFSKQAKIIG